VRALAAGRSELLVSGDAEGFVNFFRVPNVPPTEAVHKKTELADIVADIFASASAPGHQNAATTVLSDPWLETTPVEAPACDVLVSPPPPSAAAVVSSLPESDQVDASEFDASLSPKPDEPDEETAFLSGNHSAIMSDPMSTANRGNDSSDDDDRLGMSISNLMEMEPGEAPGEAMGCLGCMDGEQDKSQAAGITEASAGAIESSEPKS